MTAPAKPRIPLESLQRGTPPGLEEPWGKIPKADRQRVWIAYVEGGVGRAARCIMGVARDQLKEDSSSKAGCSLQNWASAYLLRHPSPGE